MIMGHYTFNARFAEMRTIAVGDRRQLCLDCKSNSASIRQLSTTVYQMC
jgi:hypothetical protein